MSAYNGKASLTAQASAKVETVWSVWPDFEMSAGKGKITGTFRYSNSGDWDLTVNGHDSSTISGDFVHVGIVIRKPLSNGRQLATILGDYLSAKLESGPSSAT